MAINPAINNLEKFGGFTARQRLDLMVNGEKVVFPELPGFYTTLGAPSGPYTIDPSADADVWKFIKRHLGGPKQNPNDPLIKRIFDNPQVMRDIGPNKEATFINWFAAKDAQNQGVWKGWTDHYQFLEI